MAFCTKIDYFRLALFISVMTNFNTYDVIDLCIKKLSSLSDIQVVLKSSQILGGGCINQALRITTSAGDFFVKWNASAPPDMFAKEAAGLAEMHQSNNPFLKIPNVIWHKEADEVPGILILEHLASAAATQGFDRRFGKGLANLHRKTFSAFGFHHPNYCGTTVQDNTWTNSWPEFFAQRRIWALVQQIRTWRGMSVDELIIYEKLVAKMSQLLAHQPVPSLIHGDLWSGNFMYTSKGPALIDPACYYADREMELGLMQLFGGFSHQIWEAYQDEFPLPEDWQKRISLYQLYHLLNHFLLFGGSYGRQALEIAREYL